MSSSGDPTSREPRASRPTQPAGYWDARPIPWGWARQRLVEARNYWISSVTPAGRPHARPVWGIWLDDSVFFDTGSRIGTNLEARADVTVHLESGDEVVVIEGIAERIRDAGTAARFIDLYNPKYNSFLAAPPGALFAVRPRVAFAWPSPPSPLSHFVRRGGGEPPYFEL